MRQLAAALALVTTAAAAWAATGLGQPPAAGTYAAQMCVTVAAHERKCGPVSVTLRTPDEAVLKVDDIRYRLQVRAGALVAVFVFHGNMQIDDFTAQGRWQGHSLEWFDQAKNTRYWVQLGVRLDAAAAEAPGPAASTPN
jgi:hypothetical protein